MRTHRVLLPAGSRWDETISRALEENLPYHLESGRLARADEREVVIESADEVESPQVAATVAALLAQIGSALRDARERVLSEFDAPRSSHPDPMSALLAAGDAVVVGRGRISYGGQILTVVDALDREFARLAAEHRAVARQYPTTVSLGTIARGGYLKAFPHQAMFVESARKDSQALSALGSWTESSANLAVLAKPDQVLAPTVCYHCFESLKESPIRHGARFTAVNACHRVEALAGASLERLQIFRMREVIGFDDAPEVARMLDDLLSRTRNALERWGVAHRVTTATDPFFAGAGGSKAFFQAAFELKRELQVRLDFSNRWLAVASFNNHQQSMTRAFDIRGERPAIESGCVGWGLERLAFALFARFGTQTNDWPATLRRDLAL